MSFYHLANGVTTATFIILPMLGRHPDQYPRFRDCFVFDKDRPEDTKGKITIYTRTGGTNRILFFEENKEVEKMDGFLFSYNCSQDSTFSRFVFDVPERFKEDYDGFVSKDFDCSKNLQQTIYDVYPKLKDKFKEMFELSVTG